MAKHINEQSLKAIERVVRSHSAGGMSVQEIADALKAAAPPRRTLQHHLRQLVDRKRLAKEGESRWTRYRALYPAPASPWKRGLPGADDADISCRFPKRPEIQAYVRQPVAARKPVGYDRGFLDAYRPNVTFYLTEEERNHLHQVGTPQSPPQPAGTYAKQILEPAADRPLLELEPP